MVDGRRILGGFCSPRSLKDAIYADPTCDCTNARRRLLYARGLP